MSKNASRLRDLVAVVGLVVLLLALPTRAEEGGLAFREIVSDDFAAGMGAWEHLGGTWHASGGRLSGRDDSSGGDAFSYRQRVPLLGKQAFEAVVNVRGRTDGASWSFAGVVLMLDTSNFWLLALVEGPDGARYVDFLENCGGVWKANQRGATALMYTPERDLGLDWEYGKDYRLQLSMSQDGISGHVCDAASGEVLAGGRHEFGGRQAVRTGMGALILRSSEASFDDVSVRAPVGAPAEAGVRVESGPAGCVAILADAGLPGTDPTVATHLVGALRGAGFGVTEISADSACNPALLSAANFQLYVVPNAVLYPAEGMAALMTYVRGGGNLMVLGAPAFSRLVWRYGESWLDRQEIRHAIADTCPERLFLDLAAVDPGAWRRDSNDLAKPGKIAVVESGPQPGERCLEIRSDAFSKWDVHVSPVVPGMFPEGHGLLCFQARGDAETPQLAVELNETDGSRWIAVVPLREEWAGLVLSAEDFHYWPDSPTAKNRGWPGDRINLQAAQRIRFGLSKSHTPKVEGGAHMFQVARIGTAANPYAAFREPSAGAISPIETVTPAHKLYPLERLAGVRVNPRQVLISEQGGIPVPDQAFSCYVRSQAKGYGHAFPRRWIPLMEAFSPDGERRGALAWAVIEQTFPLNGALVVALGTSDPVFVKCPTVTASLTQLALRACGGVFLANGGATKFSYWPDEAVSLGVRVINGGQAAATTEVRLTVRAQSGEQTLFTRTLPCGVPGGSVKEERAEWLPESGQRVPATVTVELLDSGKVVDVISHELGFLSEDALEADDFVTVKDGQFMLRGKPWNPVGVNFWALYTSALEPGEYNKGWLAPGYYDPAEVERDLRRMSALGINMVSIQLGAEDSIPNLLDFLRRCRPHDIRVNGFLWGASPLGFDEKNVRAFIEKARLSRNPMFFAYDTIWEPGNYMFRRDWRKRWDKDWRDWLAEQYGSVEAAEKDWGTAVPRAADGKVVSPPDKWFREDGDWRVAMAAYRRFMDDLASRKWNVAGRKLREIDPNHLVSFRQGNTLPHDFALTATVKHIDFICPEGYSIRLGDDGHNAAGFITRFVNYTTGGKPIIWSEFGTSIWDREAMCLSEEALRRQTDYHDMFYRMAIESGANGTAPWWWPGGYRINERSDYGICNPDGTPRPAAEMIRTYAPLLKSPPGLPTETEWLTIDRDAHAGGYWYLAFNTGRDAYRDAVASGRTLGIRSAGTGTTSVNTPMVAVGNRPATGGNPHKYLNAEFNWLQVRDAEGNWVEAIDGAEITVSRETSIRARICVGNTQEAMWLTAASAAGQPGAVELASTANSAISVNLPLPHDTAYLADADFGEAELTGGIAARTQVELRMRARERTSFGEARGFVLIPSP